MPEEPNGPTHVVMISRHTTDSKGAWPSAAMIAAAWPWRAGDGETEALVERMRPILPAMHPVVPRTWKQQARLCWKHPR